MKQPDILLIMPDQMRSDCLSALGHPVVRTPQSDRLAERGVVFRRAYSTVASCIPARFGLLTGLSPQTSGVVGFAAKPITTPTLPRLLAQAGYRTALVGRSMHQRPESGDCGYDTRILGSTYVDHDDYDQFLRQAAAHSGGIRQLVEQMGLTFNHWQAGPWPLEDRLHPTAWTVFQSLKAMQQVDPRQPMFLTTSFYAPHPPLFPPRAFFAHYLEQDLPQPARGRWVDWQTRCTQGDAQGHRVLLEGDALRAAQAGYFGLIEHIDREMEKLVHAFITRSQDAGRPWVIILTSDHGEMLGDHGFFRKCQPYEAAANIPMIITGSPDLGFMPGKQIDRPVCLQDIMPTLLALGQASSPDHLDGVDLTASLRGGDDTLRDWLHFEHAPCYSDQQAYHALTDGRLKYIWRPFDGHEQLFNLSDDPQEEHDLSTVDGQRATLATWRGRLAERLAQRPEGFSRDGKLIIGRPYPSLNQGTLDRDSHAGC